MKEFAVKYRKYSLMICMDDKCIIPIGEPEAPISTGVRGHNKVLAPVDVNRMDPGDSACE